MAQSGPASGDRWVVDRALRPYDVLEARVARSDTVNVLDPELLRCICQAAARRSRGSPEPWRWAITWRGLAHCFLNDDAWRQLLAEARLALQPLGHLAFEVRNDTDAKWREWSAAEPVATPTATRLTELRRDGDLITLIDHWVQDGRSWTTAETCGFPPGQQ